MRSCSRNVGASVMHHDQKKSHIVESVIRDRYGMECIVEENGGEEPADIYSRSFN